MFFTTISALHVSGGFSDHYQEPSKLNLQPWVLSRFPAVYRCSSSTSTSGRQQERMTIPKVANTVLKAPDDGRKNRITRVES